MANSYFQFKQFIVQQGNCAMKVTTDSCLFGAWAAERINNASHTDSCGGKIKIKNCLDIGTGTGLLALMLAQVNESSIDTIEIDNEAFQQASANIAGSPWANRIKIIHADVKEFAFQKSYNIIIGNPPFYENELKGHDTKKNIAHHNDGLLLPELLDLIKKNLTSEGTFFLLLPYKRSEEIQKYFVKNDLFIHQLVFVRQSVKHDYFRIMLAGKLKSDEQAETIIEEISIKDDTGQYTPSFVSLLKDYYLHL